MMAGKSDYLSDKLLNWLRGTGMGASPTLYIGLFRGSAPADDGTGGTEVTTTIRAAGRLAATFGAPDAGTPAGRQMANSADVDFGIADADVTGGQVVAFGVFDAASAGNYLGGAALDTPLTISQGVDVSFPAGSLIWKED